MTQIGAKFCLTSRQIAEHSLKIMIADPTLRDNEEIEVVNLYYFSLVECKEREIDEEKDSRVHAYDRSQVIVTHSS